jgi:uncharacterized protein YndB with AHSA1/START domain
MTTPSLPAPTGTVTEGPSGRELRLIRRFGASTEDVWAAVTDSPRLERWIGRWEGDPKSGRVRFITTADGDEVAAQDVEILECAPPHRLSVTMTEGETRWCPRIELRHETDGTILLFTLNIVQDVASVGPGWEYYLDRLVAVIEERDPASVNWDDYFPKMSEHYATLCTQG